MSVSRKGPVRFGSVGRIDGIPPVDQSVRKPSGVLSAIMAAEERNCGYSEREACGHDSVSEVGSKLRFNLVSKSSTSVVNAKQSPHAEQA